MSPNRANVDALAQQLAASLQGDWQMTDTQIQLMAHRMAESGCLMPSALTDKQAVSTNRDHPWIEDTPERAALARFVRERLAQIARGDDGA